MSWQLVIDLDRPYDLIIDGKAIELTRGRIIVPFADKESATSALTSMRTRVQPAPDDFTRGDVIPGKVDRPAAIVYHHAGCAYGSQDHDGPCIPQNAIPGEVIR